MKSSTPLLTPAAQWAAARELQPLYTAMAREFVIDVPACSDLDAGVEAPPQESIDQARHWFEEMDQRIQVHQLRQFLQTSPMATENALRILLAHQLHKEQRSESDRDKADFLLVQYFSHCAPSGLQDTDLDLEYVAQVLEPVLGTFSIDLPDWIKPLEDLLQAANECRALNDVLSSGILEKGRKLKVSCGDQYYLPTAMVAFTRFSFMMRRVFFRLMHQDLNAILDGLRELEHRGIHTLDCRRAQFSAEEPTARLRLVCQSWKVMFQAEYSSGQPLRMLVDLRGIAERALARPAMAKAHAAGAGAGAASSDVPEFEVSASSWQPDAPGHDPSAES